MSDHKRDEFDDLISFFQLNDSKNQSGKLPIPQRKSVLMLEMVEEDRQTGQRAFLSIRP